MNQTNIIIGASFFALFALFAFQVKWMTDSRKLIEEQFNQKVNMALCYAVSLLDIKEGSGQASCTTESTDCAPAQPVPVPVDNGFQLETNDEVALSAIESVLYISLKHYKIDLDYQVEIVEQVQNEIILGSFPVKRTYSCSLNPLEVNKSKLLKVSFPGKQEYIFGKLKFMFFSSIVILSFLTLVFILASYNMLRQKRMHQINKEFFNNMAHEFRTPLTNISLAGTLLAKDQQDPKKIRYIEVVKEESKKLAHQVDRILQLAKLENGEYQLAKEKLCLKDLIQTVISDMELQIKAKNASIDFDITNEEIMLEGDKFHLGNAFRNLLENALKYSKATPEIKISLEKNKDGVLIHFQDNGIGIAQKDQKEIFEKYHRINHGNVHNQKGFGLGLAYVKMIIERHKGIIKIFSDLNKGTRFDLFLPAK